MTSETRRHLFNPTAELERKTRFQSNEFDFFSEKTVACIPEKATTMSIHHIRPGEIADVSPLGPLLASATSHALFKSADLEVIRSVMRAGDMIPPHAVAGESTVQCIEGKVQLTCTNGVQELSPGQLAYLGRQEMHAILCSGDASLLRTICLLANVDNGVKTSGQVSS